MNPARRNLLQLTGGLLLNQICRRAAFAEPVSAKRAAQPAKAYDDRVVVDPSTGRKIQLRLRLPASRERGGLIVYTPGLGSGIGNGASWCEAWRRAGFTVATLAHPGTGEDIWDTSRRDFRANMAAALSPAQYAARVQDCKFAIAHCLENPGIAPYADAAKIGIAGHSFGSFTVESMARRFQHENPKPGSFRIRAAIAFSPGSGNPAAAANASDIRIPYFCITGERDNYVTLSANGHAVRTGAPLQNRIAVYEHLPRGARQLLVLARADHMTFAGEMLSREKFSRDLSNPEREDASAWPRLNHATAAFWKYYLSGNPGGRKQYLDQLRSGLDPADRLQAG